MKRILLCKPKMCGREIDFIRDALAEDWAVPMGPDCNAFEKDLEEFVNSKPLPNPPRRGGSSPTIPVTLSDSFRRNMVDTITYPLLKENAKRMRSNQTQAETIMWKLLRNKSLGVKFRRQHVIDNFIADFVNLTYGLVIEIDGAYHNDSQQAEYDDLRTQFLESKGFKVLRFTNEDVLYDTDRVLNEIKDNLCEKSRINPQTEQDVPQQPSPLRGEMEGGRKVVALSAGTAAIHLALIACGVGPGDEVIVQSFTFCASSNPVAYLGATPVFVDSEPDTWNIDPALMETAIQDRIAKTGKTPKAIIPVALYGMPYRIDRIMEIADRYGIPVIEDAAEGFGSRFGGQVLGTFGRYGVLSFNGNKMITTSGGGALICRDEEAKKEIMWLATQARESYPYYQHEAIGYNYRMSNISACIGRAQMTVLEDYLAHHRHVQELYRDLLADVPGITLHEAPGPEFEPNFWLCTATLGEELRVKGEESAYSEVITATVGGAAGVTHTAKSATTDCQPNANVEAMRKYLAAKGIESRPLWKPMHRQPVFKDSPAYINGVSEALFKKGICLPAGPYVTDEDVRFIVENIRDAIV